jgi:Tfp pilus assembly protein PilF
MNKKNETVTWLVVLLSGSLLVSATSCSSMKTILSWPRSFFEGTQVNHKDKDKAAAQFLSTVRPYQGNPDSHYRLACYHQERGRHKQALEEFEKVLLIDPSYFKAYNGMGISYDLLGNFPRAVEAYEAALLLNPSLDYVQNNLGYSLYLQGDLDGAMAAFKKAIGLNEREQRFHNNLGLVYAEKGQWDLAMMEFQLAGEGAKAHFNVAQFLHKRELNHSGKMPHSPASSLQNSFLRAPTELDMDQALGMIFQPATEKAKGKELTTPEQTITGVTGAEKRATPKKLTDRMTGPKGVTTPVQSSSTQTEEENSMMGSMADSRMKSPQQNGHGGSEVPPSIPETILLASFRAPEKATPKAEAEFSSSPESGMASPEKQVRTLPRELPEIPAFLAAWKRSWETKDLDQYMDRYSKDFRSRGKGWNQWRKYKKNLNESYRQIEVSLEDVKITETHGQALVSFRQSYRSDKIKDVGQKVLGLRIEGNSWKILRESFIPFKEK